VRIRHLPIEKDALQHPREKKKPNMNVTHQFTFKKRTLMLQMEAEEVGSIVRHLCNTMTNLRLHH